METELEAAVIHINGLPLTLCFSQLLFEPLRLLSSQPAESSQ